MLSSVSAHIDRGNIETAKVYLSELYKILKEMKEENEVWTNESKNCSRL